MSTPFIAPRRLAAVLVAALCASLLTPMATRAVPTSLSVALPLGEYPTYILPFTPASEASRTNLSYFQSSLYRPLYVVGRGPLLGVQADLSPAEPPVFSNGNTTATVTMKGWNFSNGEVIDGRSVVFFFNLWRAAPALFHDTLSSSVMPNQISSVTASGSTVTITTAVAVQPDWFVQNVLARVTPLPMAWDRTSLTALAGSAQCSSNLTSFTQATARAACGSPARPALGRGESGVVKFLRTRAADRSTYVADDPIWGVTSGPWRLLSYDVKRVAPVVLVPSPTYDGPVKAPVAQLRLVPFSTLEGERTALQNGTVDVGYLGATDVQPPSAKYPNGRIVATALRARVVARYTPLWMSTFAVVNFDPTTGSSPLLRQLYFRQALQSSLNQSALIFGLYGRLAYANWSAVPAFPSSPALGTATNPYPYNVVRAKKYLTDNGWTVPVRGVATCVRDAGCGSGVPKGTSASITYKYFNAGPLVSQRLAFEQAGWAQIGIQVNLVPIESTSRLVRECVSGSPGTAWQICELSPWAYFPDTYPSGEALFHSTSPANIGSFRDTTMDAIVTATSFGSEPLGTRYAAYSATQLPVLYQPNRGALVAWSKRLKAALGPSPTDTFLPEFFHP